MKLLDVEITKPEDVNVVLGQAHFIKTVGETLVVPLGAVSGSRDP